MAEEWGVGFGQLVRILRALSDIAGERSDGVGVAKTAELERDLSRRVAVPIEIAAAAIDRLTLGPCAEFDTFDEAYKPGRANRERSYLRRPWWCSLAARWPGRVCTAWGSASISKV